MNKRNICAGRRWVTEERREGGESLHGEEEGRQEDEEEVGPLVTTRSQHISRWEGVRTRWRRRRRPRKRRSRETLCTTVGGGGLPPLTMREGANAPSRLCLNHLRDFSRLEAAGADPRAPGASPCRDPHRDEVRQPPALGELVGVTDGVTDGGTFPANIAALGHDDSLEVIAGATATSVVYSMGVVSRQRSGWRAA